MTGWTTQEIRERATDLLIERGWAPGGNDERGAINADWAIALASGEAPDGIPEEDGPYLTTMSELEALLGRGSLMDWEFEEGRTAEQVIELLRSGYVAGGAYPPLSPEEEEQARLAGERLTAALARQMEALKQMQERSGPLYELARERSRIVSAAYRAVGSPRDVYRVPTPEARTYTIAAAVNGWRYVHLIKRGPRRWQEEPATEEEWSAWEAWCRERERLRKELGIGRYAKSLWRD